MPRNPKHPMSMRLPEVTLRQIETLAAQFGGANNVIQTAIDRMFREEIEMATKSIEIVIDEQGLYDFCDAGEENEQETRRLMNNYTAALTTGLEKLNPGVRVEVSTANRQTYAGYTIDVQGVREDEAKADYETVCDELTRSMDWAK